MNKKKYQLISTDFNSRVKVNIQLIDGYTTIESEFRSKVIKEEGIKSLNSK